MGWFDGASEVGSNHGHHSHHSHRPSYEKRSKSASSIFGFGDDKHTSRAHNSSRSSFLNFAAGTAGNGKSHGSHLSAQILIENIGRSSSSSYYKRSPRKGYVNKMMSQARRLFRDLLYYLKKNPIKVFMLVIMPLITGGLLTGLLAKFGIRLPVGVERMISKLGGNAGPGVGRNGHGDYQYERKSYDGPLGGMGGGLGNIAAGVGGLGTAMSMAKMFM